MKLSKLDKLLNRLHLWQKFAILGVFGVVLVAAPFFLYIHESGKTINAAKMEYQGIQPIEKLLTALQFSQQHRGVAMLTLNNDSQAESQQREISKNANTAYGDLDQALKSDVTDQDILNIWQATLKSWQNVSSQVAKKSVNAKDSFELHTATISNLLRIKSLLMQYYGLSFDAQADGFYLIEAALNQAPALTEVFGQTRALGSGILAKRNIWPEERVRIGEFIKRSQEIYGNLNDALAGATKHYPNLALALQGPGEKALAAADNVNKITSENIINAKKIEYSGDKYFNEYTNAINAQFALNSAALAELKIILQSRIQQQTISRYILAGSIILVSLLAGFINLLITRGLIRQLGGEPNYAYSILNQIAAGNLAVPVKLNNKDDISLLYAMHNMRDRLSAIVGQVRHGANSIASAAAQISAGNLDLSARTEEQASSLAETAATTEQITATVRQNADNAQQANSLAATAAKTATAGGDIVSELVTTMGEINERSAQVADIINVIDSIAFQTNILALNASVEAARAGEQGRGFAVVASEVRALAQRSANAAREIKTLIDASVEAAAKGNEQATHAGNTMGEIVQGVNHVTDIMSAISSASKEQTIGIEEINAAVTQMDDVTRQNASLVEQSVAAAASLQEQADHLAQLVSIFQVDEHAVLTANAPMLANY